MPARAPARARRARGRRVDAARRRAVADVRARTTPRRSAASSTPPRSRRALDALLAAAAPMRASLAAVAFTGQREGHRVRRRAAATRSSPRRTSMRARRPRAWRSTPRTAREVYARDRPPAVADAGAREARVAARAPPGGRRARRATCCRSSTGWRRCSPASPRMSRSLAAENGLLDVTHRRACPPICSRGSASAAAAAARRRRWRDRRRRRARRARRPARRARRRRHAVRARRHGRRRAGECGRAAGWSAPLQLVTDAPGLRRASGARGRACTSCPGAGYSNRTPARRAARGTGSAR